MADNARGIHVSPGIYSREMELNYAVRSLGITTLGVAGETLKGPAFQPIDIANWREFQDVFGGTSTEKFKGSQYPKYELPYIAKSYLSESEQLKVVRVLGLGGYNAGPAWIVTASKSGEKNGNKQVVAVLRSRGYYRDYLPGESASCICEASKYDTLRYMVGELSAKTSSGCARTGFNSSALTISAYTLISDKAGECNKYTYETSSDNFSISQLNHGRFNIIGTTTPGNEAASGNKKNFEYSVSLNPQDKDYILKVLGTNNDDGDAPIFVEALYDVGLEQGIANGELTTIDSGLTYIQPFFAVDCCRLAPVDGILDRPQSSLTRKDVGKRFIADSAATATIKWTPFYKGKAIESSGIPSACTTVAGDIYTVRQYTYKNGKRDYLYTADVIESSSTTIADHILSANTSDVSGSTLVLNKADGLYWRFNSSGSDIVFVDFDMNDYKSAYRYASTPWIVSNLKGDAKHVELNKLFRFHTISDGTNANYEIKVSIENIKPDEGVFDVVVRRIDDLDESIIPLESFKRCSMIPSDSNYIAYRIGSFDGVYEPNSKYITVEVNETITAKNSVPAGFLGYPMPNFSGVPLSGSQDSGVTNIKLPKIQYNRSFDPDIKNRKQYFGLSSWVGVDIDTFTFKGNKTYIENPSSLSHGFHLDSRLDEDHGGVNASAITVDGESGYTFDSVSVDSRTQVLNGMPIIDTEDRMAGSIYEYVNLRKFTVYFYGGFDGWDIYRSERTNTDNFKMTQYQGYINQESGEGYSFSKIQNPELLQLNQNGITSDWYAYLSGIRQFANPEANDINVLATPGIDYVNQKLLVDETIEMVEEERADSIYVVTTPDKPSGAGDYVDEMYTPEEVVLNLEDSDIDSNYSCTYYPWVKYFDQDNNQYIFLPPTKDVVRNFAQTDNQTYPWFAPAGINRGDVDCVKAKFVTKLADEDTLYEGRINPIKTFAQDGPKIWGQKNLQINESQLNRIAVRRLLLRMRKLVAISCIGLIFQPNDTTIKQSFISAVSPILDSIRSNRGISDYKIEVNDSPESRERRELPAKIYFKPYNTLEYISIDFILTPEGVSFDNI